MGKRCPNLHLKAEDFQRGKQLTPTEREYILERHKNNETYTTTVPRNEVGEDIAKLSNELQEQRLQCVLKRKMLDDLDKEKKKLEQELENTTHR